MKRLFAISATFLLLSCSTEPLAKLSDYKQIPAANLYKFKNDEDYNVVIARDGGFMGSLVRIMLFVDGEQVGLFERGEKATLKITEGSHIFGAGYYNSSATPPVKIESETEVLISKNVGFYRIFIEANVGIPKITKTSQLK